MYRNYESWCLVLNYCNEGASAFINTTIDISLEFRIVVLPRGFHPTIVSFTEGEAVGWNGNTTIAPWTQEMASKMPWAKQTPQTQKETHRRWVRKVSCLWWPGRPLRPSRQLFGLFQWGCGLTETKDKTKNGARRGLKPLRAQDNFCVKFSFLVLSLFLFLGGRAFRALPLRDHLSVIT